jgi:capsular exopolysaccharide synthesis family protein
MQTSEAARLRRIFGIETDSGLSTYLAGTSAIEFVVPEGVEHLQVVPSGPVPPNPSELIGSKHLQDLVASWEEKFDFVVWDSPTLFAAAESLVLSRMLSGTIIVTRAGKTTYKDLERGIKSVHDIEARILGIVINGLNIRKTCGITITTATMDTTEQRNINRTEAPKCALIPGRIQMITRRQGGSEAYCLVC